VTINGITEANISVNAKTVTEGNPSDWFNALMFQLPVVGYLGEASRDILRGPGLGEWDFSAIKHTRAGFLRRKGNG
jgi:hypothetical protein